MQTCEPKSDFPATEHNMSSTTLTAQKHKEKLVNGDNENNAVGGPKPAEKKGAKSSKIREIGARDTYLGEWRNTMEDASNKNLEFFNSKWQSSIED
jgi:hypothetical protein